MLMNTVSTTKDVIKSLVALYIKAHLFTINHLLIGIIHISSILTLN